MEESGSVCMNCNNEADKPANLTKHDIYEDLDQPSTSNCGTCNFVSEDEIDLRKHMESSHTYKNKKFECSQCSFLFGNEDELKTHVRLNHNPFHREKCHLYFREDLKLKMIMSGNSSI